MSRSRSGQVRSPKWKCCISVVRHMFYGSFGTQNTMVAFIFRFDPRKGQYKVKLGQKRSNFQNQNFHLKTCLSCPVLSQDSKNVIYFYVRQLEMPKIAFQKVTSSPLPGFLTIAQPKIKILLWYWYVWCLYVVLKHIFRFCNSNILDFISIYFWKIKILSFGGQNWKQ